MRRGIGGSRFRWGVEWVLSEISNMIDTIHSWLIAQQWWTVELLIPTLSFNAVILNFVFVRDFEKNSLVSKNACVLYKLVEENIEFIQFKTVFTHVWEIFSNFLVGFDNTQTGYDSVNQQESSSECVCQSYIWNSWRGGQILYQLWL